MKFIGAFVLIASVVCTVFAGSEFKISGRRCDIPCTNDYRPVCGSNGQHKKMFPNPCALRNQHCFDGHEWLQTRTAECHKGTKISKHCEVPCTREYMPVCGSNGVQLKTFSNKCVLKNEHCKDGKTWLQTRADVCESESEVGEQKLCEVPCTREYIPVCGTDGKQHKVFANNCILRNQHCRDGHTWFQSRMEECESESEDMNRCETPCSRIYLPVCGTDGKQRKMFANNCILRNQHCKDGHTWFQTRMDECETQSTTEEEKPCEVPCFRNYRPVCGFNGETYKIFPNKCALGNEHCKDGHTWMQTLITKCP